MPALLPSSAGLAIFLAAGLLLPAAAAAQDPPPARPNFIIFIADDKY
jgi:hypothetical protein